MADYTQDEIDWVYMKGVITGVFIGSLAWCVVGVYV